MGLAVCESLVRAGCRQIATVNRSGKLSDDVRQSWERLGVRVWTLSADLSDLEAAHRVFEWARDQGMRHLVHAAGVSEMVPLADVDADSLARGMAAKITPVRALLRSSFRPETAVLLSSTAGVWSQSGGASYAAANAWLDATAARENAAGSATRFRSLQLGPFGEVGMAASHAESLAALGLRPLRARQVAEAACIAMHGPASSLLFADLDLARLREIYGLQGPWRLLDDAGSGREARSLQNKESTRHVAPAASAQSSTPIPSTSELERLVRAAAHDITGMDLSGRHKRLWTGINFLELRDNENFYSLIYT